VSNEKEYFGMSRTQVNQEMQQALGVVPSFFKTVPEDALEAEWQLFKRDEMMEGPIPLKYKHLIGLCLAAAIKCKYCLHFETEMSKLHGATDAEIEDALRHTKCTLGWSAYITGLQTDFDQFKKDVATACTHAKSMMKQPVGAR
jgi:AhpD family alkylhydroperoxidase